MESLEEMLVRHEGLRLKPYRDSVNKLTIGVGRNLDDVGISEVEARYLLKNDIQRVVSEASQFPWYAAMNDARKTAICDALFNMGLPSFLTFKRMIAALERGDYPEAAKELLDSLYARQVGQRAVELATILHTGTMGEP